jgi:hypothetical protein
MPLLIERPVVSQTTSQLLTQVTLTSLAMLAALELREFVVLVVKTVEPPGTKARITFAAFVALLVMLLTVVLTIAMA